MLIYTRLIMALAVINLCLAIIIAVFGSGATAGISLIGVPLSMLFLWLSWTNWVDAAKCANEWAPEKNRNQGFFDTNGYELW